MDISIAAMVMLGIGAGLIDVYQVLVKESVRDLGSLLAVSFITLAYATSGYFTVDVVVIPAVRIGVAMMFLDKIITSVYDLNICSKVKIIMNAMIKPSGGLKS